jgi:DNA-3-methyladenine glycosylase
MGVDFNKRLKRSFFGDHPENVAPRLLGKYLVVEAERGRIAAKITETEAYGGVEDDACHVGRFGKTKRTEMLFGEVGRAYIYSVYINTYCLNVVCHREGRAGGILIRSAEPIEGIDLILENLNMSNKKFDITKLLNGPGKLCKALKINKTLNGEDMVDGDKIYFLDGKDVNRKDILATPRINIEYAKKAKDWLWRFVIKGSKFVSR